MTDKPKKQRKPLKRRFRNMPASEMQRIASAYNDVDKYPTRQDVADKLGISLNYLKHLLKKFRKTGVVKLTDARSTGVWGGK